MEMENINRQTSSNDVVNRFKDDLNKEPEMFILNNILLSIQFFENFDREMATLQQNPISTKETEINKVLSGDQKHCLLPDTVLECVNERVRFIPFHGSTKHIPESLLRQRMFIIHDNIEVLYDGDPSKQNTIGGPVHTAVIEFVKNEEIIQLRVKKHKNEDMSNDNISDTKNFKPQKSSPSGFSNVAESSSPITPTSKFRLFTKNQPTSPSHLLKDAVHFSFSDKMVQEHRRSSESRKTSLKNKLSRAHSFSTSGNKNISTTKMQASLSMENINNVCKETEHNDNIAESKYSSLSKITAEKSFNKIRTRKSISNLSSLPPNCITKIKVNIWDDDNDSDDDNYSDDDNDSDDNNDSKNDSDSDDDSDSDYDSNSDDSHSNNDSDSDYSVMKDGTRKRQDRRVRTEIKHYLNSAEFFVHFSDAFKNMYSTLGFPLEHFQNAKSDGEKIYCHNIDSYGNINYYEVIPSVQAAPSLAYEWKSRKRNTISDHQNRINYTWPTKKMCRKIELLQAQVLPTGFAIKRDVNENRALKWKVSFPAAERYLLTCMSHSQIRCYLFIMAIYKTFIEPANTKLGLAPHHILTLMFWEIEKNYYAWPEDRLGTKMIRLLKILYSYLSKGYLPDYFLKNRNILENCPNKCLRISQSILHNIIEKPVMHFLIAMKNLRYTSTNFFPDLEFKELYEIITTNHVWNKINSQIPRQEFKNAALADKKRRNKKKIVDKKITSNPKLRKDMELQQKDKQKNIRKMSVDSIELIPVPKICEERRLLLLEFFINHFLEVAKYCFNYESYEYTLLILEHCLCLTNLLREEPSGAIHATSLKKEILAQRKECRYKIRQVIPKVNPTRQTRNFNKGNAIFERKNRPGNIKLSAEINPQRKVQKPSSENDRPEKYTTLADVYVHF